MTARAAVLLDVDGTLLDTNYLHVAAWWQAFTEAGHDVSCYDVHRALGLPSADLVTQLLGQPDDRVVDGHARAWAGYRGRARPFHRARDLQRTCAERGLAVVWATSGDPQDVAAARTALDSDRWVTARVTSEDVEHGKPAPDLVRAACQAAGVAPQRAVMVGDSVYDVRAARAAGAASIALLGGGLGAQELREAGADAVYGNCSELLEDLDGSPLGALLRAVDQQG